MSIDHNIEIGCIFILAKNNLILFVFLIICFSTNFIQLVRAQLLKDVNFLDDFDPLTGLPCLNSIAYFLETLPLDHKEARLIHSSHCFLMSLERDTLLSCLLLTQPSQSQLSKVLPAL